MDTNQYETTPDTDRTARSTAPATDDDSGASQYIAVVDRIVDDRFVVLLLEDDGELVDQHVEPAAEMDDVEETDILQVVLKDGSVLTYTQLDERPGSSVDENEAEDEDRKCRLSRSGSVSPPGMGF